MRIGKRLLRSGPIRDLLALLLFAYVRLCERTTRWTQDDSALRPLLDSGRGGIACFWHGRMMLMHRAWTPRPKPFYMMISVHRDGAFVTRAVRMMNVHALGADKKSGGLSALRACQRIVARGDWVGVTPDGPRGPRMRARSGAVKLAQLTGRPMLPVSLGLSRRRVLNSWDRFLLALPFGRGEIRYGTPIHVPRDADPATLEACRMQLERELNRLTRELDLAFGQSPVDPAATPAPERLDDASSGAAAAPGARGAA